MRVFSGIQPTGVLTIGNYLGAMKQFLDLHHQAECFFCIANLHSLTVPRDPADLRSKTLDVAAYYLAIGLDPRKATIFVQSDVPYHSEAAWLLQCIVRMGELNRMVQFKEKGKGSDTAVVGLFTYPVLQGADILLYQATHVPVGEDQKQHLELTKELAKRFNRDYAEIFTIPDVMIGKGIKGLDNPLKKMSKSAESEWNYITLLDNDQTIERKIKRAVTDSENVVRFDDEQKPGVSNLLMIYHLLTLESIEQIEERYRGLGYRQFKQDLSELVIQHLSQIKKNYQEIRHSTELQKVISQGAERANKVAKETISTMREAMGLI